MTLNPSDPRIRSGFNFVVFLIVAIGMTVFVLNKAKEAIAEIQRLSETPAMQIRRNLEQEDIIYFRNSKYEGWEQGRMQTHCENLGGIFNPCGSACKDPQQICIQVCASRCKFDR